MRSKAILVIADGMADRPLKELGWKTPLETAHRPTMNYVAAKGVNGIVDPIAPGVPPGSDTATLAMLGYDSSKVYTGRGAIEALGLDITVLPGDVAFRCNFATVDKEMVVLDRRAGRISNEEASKLSSKLQTIEFPEFPDIDLTFKNAVQHRAALVIHGPKLSSAISASDPESAGRKVLEVEPLNATEEARRTAAIMNALTQRFHEVLKNDPVNRRRVECGLPAANMVLFRGAGTLLQIPSLQEKFGVKTACVGAVSLIRGVCKAAGMTLINVEGATGTPQTDYLAKAKAVAAALKTNDFVLLHVKAPDAASHDGNYKLKVEILEKVDSMLDYLIKHVDAESTYLAFTADHTTSSRTRNHEGDPVPVAILGPDVRCDEVKEFGERTCANGGLNRMRGIDLMSTLMGLIGRTKKFGS